MWLQEKKGRGKRVGAAPRPSAPVIILSCLKTYERHGKEVAKEHTSMWRILGRDADTKVTVDGNQLVLLYENFVSIIILLHKNNLPN